MCLSVTSFLPGVLRFHVIGMISRRQCISYLQSSAVCSTQVENGYRGASNGAH